MRLFWPALLMLTASCGVAEEGSQPVVTGRFGSKPIVDIPKGQPGRTPRITVLSVGSGRRTVPGDVVLTDVDIRGWSGNRPYLSTHDGHQPTKVVFDGRQVAETWRQSLIGRPAGSRVMLVSPAGEAMGPDVPLTGVSPADTLVLVFDILGGYPADARLVGRTLPVVPAGLTPADPPRTLIDGSGPEVVAGSKVVIQYVAAAWPSRAVVDSSYRRGGPSAFTLVAGSVPEAWVGALAGRRVGSRVAVPSPGAEPVLYVIDILDTITPA
ncbi:FKBP-type peptidyl-prolyl cis-trans isomerase [Nonomuraea gerenzanensis]|uniref:peptidylprolyl isomerase n=1 Tax=Nonomuraea gerenzanensis TaxID=93944 RepID=A0A1M4DWC6_9ACTN|nr:FKBP-type peptidyl-prolyl cis-trans isomerase [Nonomuraea gerenzanensis]UBU13205.1 FKBP-type peptidyl-prolyl cis-trans isomerase [Nonomuraea gerenzanensis]SBO90855.1 FKBP-type peptidyl-prolyl cis-trans isomerases 1 [Nonomuraea gerenzanensis]